MVHYAPSHLQEGHERFSAQIRNISVGGMNMVTNHEFKEGDLLSLHLPNSDEHTDTTVLACVVHVHPNSDQQSWTIGCTFARELSESDLARFTTNETVEGDHDLRRRERFFCDIHADYQIVTSSEARTYQAKVLNISTNGIGLLVEQHIDVGTLLSVDLSVNDDQPKTILSCVVHATERDNGETALGCNFITEMSESDLQSLLE